VTEASILTCVGVVVCYSVFELYIFRRKQMATVAEFVALVSERLAVLTPVVQGLDVKLDELRALILALRDGGSQPVSQEQVDAIVGAFDALTASLQSVAAEAEAADD